MLVGNKLKTDDSGLLPTFLVPVPALMGFADVIMSPAFLARVTRVEEMPAKSAFQHLSSGVMVDAGVCGRGLSVMNPRNPTR